VVWQRHRHKFEPKLAARCLASSSRFRSRQGALALLPWDPDLFVSPAVQSPARPDRREPHPKATSQGHIRLSGAPPMKHLWRERGAGCLRLRREGPEAHQAPERGPHRHCQEYPALEHPLACNAMQCNADVCNAPHLVNLLVHYSCTHLIR